MGYKLNRYATPNKLRKLGFTEISNSHEPDCYINVKHLRDDISLKTIISFKEKSVTYFVCNRNGETYAPYYNRNFGRDLVRDEIVNKVDSYLSKLIKEKIIRELKPASKSKRKRDNKNMSELNARTRGFEVVRDDMRKTTGNIKLPTRADYRSAGYDFYAPTNYKCDPHKVTKIWTDVKCYMQPTDVLLLDVRSSMGGKFHLANTIGVIDASFYENPDNDGGIGIFLVNDTDETIQIKAGDRIAQGIFVHYLITDDDKPLSDTRTGGFGSSGR